MDDPELDPDIHSRALRGLQRINRMTNSSRVLWKAIRQFALSAQRPIQVLDVACGGGDVLADLALRAKKSLLQIDWLGWDISPTAVQQTSRRADRCCVEINVAVENALTTAYPAEMDVIFCSLFLHHLSHQDAHLFLERTRQAAPGLFIVSDLVRSEVGYQYAWWGTRLLSRSPIVHIDGPRSVEAALTIPEMRVLADECGLGTGSIASFWPERFLFQWSPDLDKVSD